MKKVLLSLTLFMASFFFITLNKVSAHTIDINVSSDYISLINDDFFNFREQVIEFANTNNFYYVITNYNSVYYARFISSESDFSIIHRDSTASLYFNIKNFHYYKFENNKMVFSSIKDTANFVIYNSSSFELTHYPLDSNFNLYFNLSDTLNIKYNDLSYSITSGMVLPTFYQIYLDENSPPTDPFEEDKVILNNFYTTIFTKISDLAINLANNYTFLLIFGIFILIFVFELIWRRFI